MIPKAICEKEGNRRLRILGSQDARAVMYCRFWNGYWLVAIIVVVQISHLEKLHLLALYYKHGILCKLIGKCGLIFGLLTITPEDD